MVEAEARLKCIHEQIDRSDSHNLRMWEILENLEDAMLVQSQVEKRQWASLKEHADYIVRIERNLAEMTDKMNVLSACVMTRDHLPESGS